MIIHGHNRRGKTTKEYRSWYHMKTRCYNKKRPYWKYYGGRGIKVCDRWKDSFVNFLSDMGNKPTSKHSLDRIDNNGDYSPDNCKWSTSKQQTRNKRSNIMIEYNGKIQCLNDWAKELEIKRTTLWMRIYKYHLPLFLAFTIKPNS